jgi:hypothetical protein
MNLVQLTFQGLTVFLFFFFPRPGSQPAITFKIKRKGEEDFYEADLSERTFAALTSLIEAELDLDTSKEKIVKIRKLPNVVLRKDADVARLDTNVEIEVEVGSV